MHERHSSTGQPNLVVRKVFDRVPSAVRKKFEGVPTGNVADAQGRRGALDSTIRPIGTATTFCGSALPVYAGPDDNLAAWAALESVLPGDVIVIDTHGWLGGSVIGDGFVGMARNAGVAAIVTDGLVRDREGLDAIGIPVFARGLSPNSPQKHGPGRIGLDLSIDGVAVCAGDLIVGDGDGVVVVPCAAASAVAEALQEVGKKESAMAAAVEQGVTAPGWLQDVLARLRVERVD